MTDKIELLENFRIINCNFTNDLFQKEDIDIMENKSNDSIHYKGSIHYNNSIYAYKNLNKLLKPFDLSGGQNYTLFNSNSFSTDLKIFYSRRDFGTLKYEKERYKTNKFKIKKTKKRRPKQSSNDKINKIFSIKKVAKLGRIRKTSNKRGKHDKFKRDNIIRRFKVHFMQSLYDYINSLFLINKKCMKYKKVIKKISYYDTTLISKKDNIEWLNSSIRNIFSKNITSKISIYNNDYNKKLIGLIYEENIELDVINILNKTIREMWLVYINDDKEKSYTGFATLKDDVNKLRQIGETESYINHYIFIANEFENIIDGMMSRK